MAPNIWGDCTQVTYIPLLVGEHVENLFLRLVDVSEVHAIASLIDTLLLKDLLTTLALDGTKEQSS